MTQEPIIIEREFDASAKIIWEALTDKAKMKEWYFDLDEFKPEVGFKFEFLGGKDADNQYLHLCEVTEAIPPKKLTYSWKYDGYAGISFVTFELSEKGSKTLLKLTHTGLDSFPKENTDFARGNFVEGWTQIINTSLKNYLNE